MSIKNAKSQLGAFIDAEPETVENTKPVKKNTGTPSKGKAKTPEPDTIPAGYVLKPEPKSKRTSVLLKPSVYEELVKKADAAGTSLNNYICEILERNINK